jgi:hypothetical protein
LAQRWQFPRIHLRIGMDGMCVEQHLSDHRHGHCLLVSMDTQCSVGVNTSHRSQLIMIECVCAKCSCEHHCEQACAECQICEKCDCEHCENKKEHKVDIYLI